MKKNSLKLALLLLLIVPATVFPQFLRGVGIYGAETSSRDGYRNTHSRKLDEDPLFIHSTPASHRGGEYESWGAGIFLEMLNSDMWRWRTEIEYANKGSKESGGINPYYGFQQSG